MDITPWASICLLQLKNTKTQKHNKSTQNKKNYEILWTLPHGPTLVCFKPKTQKTQQINAKKGKIMKPCGYYGMGQHLLLKEKVIK